LTPQQWRQLLRILKRGAYAAGFPTDRWTLPRIQQIVKKPFDVEHSPSWLCRRLHQLNWSPQKPAPRAKERDEALIQAWQAQDWPRTKKKSTAKQG
jgi:transposase